MKKKAKIKENKTEKPDYKDLTYKYKLLSELMDRVPDVIYFKDKKGRLIMVNQAHARGLGLRPADVAGKTDFDFFPKKRAELMKKDDSHVLKTGKAIIDKVERATRPDGIDNYVSTTKIPRYDEKGNIVGLIGITRDITHRMQVEHLRGEKERIQKKLEALEELSTMKSEFVSVVSHELRTPLAIIKEAVLLILEEIAGSINNKQKDLLARARSNVDRLGNIIEELLDISRIERGKLSLHYSLVNLNDLLQDSSDYFKKLAQEKRIRLDYFLPKDQVNIFVDAERINQVLSNLIGNAIKFTEENGEIKVELQILDTKVRIGVMDTGVGISEQDLPKLFDKFVQVSKSSEAKNKGVGLGLLIAKELVERHGGEVWVEAKMGVGSKFYFTLPLFYTKKVLDKDVRSSINSLLNKGTPVYFINLLIINFKEFKKKADVHPQRLFKGLRGIIDTALDDFYKQEAIRPQIVLEDYGSGEWNMLFPEIKESKAAKICNLLKEKIEIYFLENKIKDVFINLGVISYSCETKDSKSKRFPANVHIKRIYIGPEVRRFKRAEYRMDIEVLSSQDERVSSESVDISEGGLCLISERRLTTDAAVKLRFKLPDSKDLLDLKACVAWERHIREEASGKGIGKYKVGLKFIELKDKERRKLSVLVNSL